MIAIDSIKDKIRILLIEKDGDVQPHELKFIIDEAKQLGIDDRQIAKLVPEIDRSINWEHIRKQKEEERERLKKFEEETKKKEEEIQSAPEFIDALIQYCLADGIVESKELHLIYAKAIQLKQDPNALSRKLKATFDDNKYKPHPNPDLKSTTLQDTLLSTNWYAPKQYTIATTPPPPPPIPFPWKKLIVAAALIISTVSFLGYLFWYKPYLVDKNATRMYSFASSLTLRSSPAAGGNFNAIGNINYGTEILVYSLNGDWVECKANGNRGFLSSKYLLNKKDFYELNGILADSDTRGAIETTKCRKALLNYFSTHNIMGKLEEQIQKEIYDSVQHKEVWQVFTKPKNSKPNTVAYPKVVSPNSKFTDFACLIKNINSGKRRFLLFSFNDQEDSTLVFEEDAPDDGYIKSVTRSRKSDGIYLVTYTF